MDHNVYFTNEKARKIVLIEKIEKFLNEYFNIDDVVFNFKNILNVKSTALNKKNDENYMKMLGWRKQIVEYEISLAENSVKTLESYCEVNKKIIGKLANFCEKVTLSIIVNNVFFAVCLNVHYSNKEYTTTQLFFGKRIDDCFEIINMNDNTIINY